MRQKALYAIGEMPPLGTVPKSMHAYLIRQDRFGDPIKAFRVEQVEVPSIKPDEALVYVMAAGINYNNVWAALGSPVDVIKSRQKDPDTVPFHIGGSDASGIVYAVGAEVKGLRVGDQVVIHCGMWSCDCPVVRSGADPMFSPTFRIWGYEANWGSFAQFTKVQAHQCLPKAPHLTWEEAAAPTLVGATAYRMLRAWPPHTVEKGDVVLIWGGSGGLGSTAVPIVRGGGGRPPSRRRFERGQVRLLPQARGEGLHQPQGVRPLGDAAALDRQRGVRKVVPGRAGVRGEVLGGPRRAPQPAHRFRAPR